MLVIRMQRTGRKRQPSFRLIIQEKARSPHSKVVEIVGFYNPRSKEKGFNEERIAYWLGQGVQPTDSVHNLLVNAGLIHAEKRRVVHLTDTRRAAIEEKKEKATVAAAAPAPVAEAAPVEEAAAPEAAVEPTPMEG